MSHFFSFSHFSQISHSLNILSLPARSKIVNTDSLTLALRQ